jgi:hypothetical protein
MYVMLTLPGIHQAGQWKWITVKRPPNELSYFFCRSFKTTTEK